jgi:SAM-dependent methyltransferase
VIYQHPLAYLLGLEGLALLRGRAGDFDRDFVLARLAEVRRLLDEPALANHPGVDVARRDSQTGYRAWAPTYDDPDTGLFAVDAPAVDAILDTLPVGDALDAACGTGRFSVRLATRGHRVVGVDSSPEMLELAREEVPGSEFHLGELHRVRPVSESRARRRWADAPGERSPRPGRGGARVQSAFESGSLQFPGEAEPGQSRRKRAKGGEDGKRP